MQFMHISLWVLSKSLLDVRLLLNFNYIKKHLEMSGKILLDPTIELKVMLICVKLHIKK
jgi:hypothetical protein